MLVESVKVIWSSAQTSAYKAHDRQKICGLGVSSGLEGGAELTHRKAAEVWSGSLCQGVYSRLSEWLPSAS